MLGGVFDILLLKIYVGIRKSERVVKTQLQILTKKSLKKGKGGFTPPPPPPIYNLWKKVRIPDSILLNESANGTVFNLPLG